MQEEISTVDSWWQQKILNRTSGTKTAHHHNGHRGPALPWEVWSLLFGLFWIALGLLVEGNLGPRIALIVLLGGPCIGLFIWRTFFYTKNWIFDIRLYEQDGVAMARFVRINGSQRICPVTEVLEMRNKVNAYEFVLASGTRLILPRPQGETYDCSHFPNCRYRQG